MIAPEENFPNCLTPYDLREAMSPADAATMANRSERTILNWCNSHGIGRRINGGKWAVSIVALAMLLDGNRTALKAYLAGDRASHLVEAYYARFGIPVAELGNPPLKNRAKPEIFAHSGKTLQIVQGQRTA
ncbi:helix-turn-helix domain-containing protein [Bradyrhizobium sp. WSM1743]|uniref:helix-turn-helix domain-containing protein n=1 Tax=Bradyrhizobium sp. WSM1743 TaxID=318996 RepID=UPI0007C59B62|nr:helix-turn-helix domain-containing protein [Bradyrhizobium sp. WSM1743]